MDNHNFPQIKVFQSRGKVNPLPTILLILFSNLLCNLYLVMINVEKWHITKRTNNLSVFLIVIYKSSQNILSIHVYNV